ncbi:MAG: response regulator [Imperialibacter sp.]|uniref:response regulator n=1 Tax=Imperialibacter sp. TaxID=2038411 RepID=UPI003A84A502
MKRVVIIDDDEIFQFLCSKALENIGCTDEIKQFTNSQKGLDYLTKQLTEESYPTMLMVDINMPLLDGWEIIEGIEKAGSSFIKNCKVFILSSSVDVKDKEKALSYKSVTGFIIKPLSESNLRNIAKEHFGLG